MLHLVLISNMWNLQPACLFAQLMVNLAECSAYNLDQKQALLLSASNAASGSGGNNLGCVLEEVEQYSASAAGW